MISENIEKILAEISEAVEARDKNNCSRTDSSSGDYVLQNPVTLVCVSKTKPLEMVKEAYLRGQRNFGENKVQEIVAKAPAMPDDTIWHMIGHLQKNKVKKAVQYSSIIHSVDSYELAEEIDKEAGRINKLQDILLEVNIADEASKYGLKPDEVLATAKQLAAFQHIRLRGLMCVAPFTENPEDNRKYFAKMRELLVDIRTSGIDNNIDILSMGMSGDYKVAIEEGATHVRIGTSIFGARNYDI